MLVLPLKSLIEFSNSTTTTSKEETLSAIVSTFSCRVNRDVEDFLKNTAIEYERKALSRTYLIVDEKAIHHGRVTVLGYFSIALKTLSIAQLSNKRRRLIHGRKSSSADPVPSFLIGQLGRNDSTTKEILPGTKIVEYALSYVEKAYSCVGGRNIILECTQTDKLLRFYEQCGFTFLQKHDNKENLIQMILCIADSSFPHGKHH